VSVPWGVHCRNFTFPESHLTSLRLGHYPLESSDNLWFLEHWHENARWSLELNDVFWLIGWSPFRLDFDVRRNDATFPACLRTEWNLRITIWQIDCRVVLRPSDHFDRCFHSEWRERVKHYDVIPWPRIMHGHTILSLFQTQTRP
jgi:hypothetical protein